MRRLMLAAPWVLLAHGTIAMAHEPTQSAQNHQSVDEAPIAANAAVSECVELTQSEVGAGIAFDVRNTCESAVRCEFSWALRCDADSEKTARRGVSQRFSLEPGAKRAFVADSAACGDDGWEIYDDSWDCVETR